MLVTGKKAKKTLKEKYLEEKGKNTSKKKHKSTVVAKKKKNYSKEKKRISIFWILVSIFGLISIVLTLTIFLLSFV